MFLQEEEPIEIVGSINDIEEIQEMPKKTGKSKLSGRGRSH